MHGDEMNPKLRTALTHLGTAGGAALATAMFLATQGVDLYAIINQVNGVVAEITKLVALATPLATAAYGVWRATTKNKLQDIECDPRVKGVITTSGLASELGPKVQASVSELPAAARSA